MALESVESMTEKVNRLQKSGWRIETHVIGDRAVDITLKAFELSDGTDAFKKSFRHILNHSQMIRPDHIPLIKKFGCSCSIQPQFVESDASWCKNSVPESLHNSLYPWKTLLNNDSRSHIFIKLLLQICIIIFWGS